MKLNRWMMVLAALTLSAGLAACDSDAGNGDGDEKKCTIGDKVCKGDTASVCEDGKWKDTKCGSGTTCLAGMCIPSGACEGNEKTCSGTDKVTACENGQWKTTDCTSGTACQNGVCTKTPDCDPSAFVAECVGDRVRTCDANGSYVLTSCKAEESCVEGVCVDLCKDKQCDSNKGEVCTQGQCVVVTRPATAIGAACTCTSDCEITITGKELKDSINEPAISTILGMFIADNDKITAPNFFSKSITGCDNVAVPNGMTLGCMYDTTITFPSSIVSLLDGLGPLLGMLGDFLPEGLDIAAIIDPLKGLLKDGIAFKAPKGYCLTAAINISAQLDPSIEAFVSSDKIFGSQGLVNKITTGDHAKAKVAVCPEGTEKFTYTVDDTIEGAGVFNVGFDMCLRGCDSNADCRTADGYSCVEIPNGVPAEGQTVDDLEKKKVCFDKSNIDYFTDLTNLFDFGN